MSSRVFQQYASYYTDAAQAVRASHAMLYSYKRGLPGLRHTIEFRLVSAEVLDEGFTFSSGWRTVTKINAGEKRSVKISHQNVSSFVIEQSETTKLLGNMTMKLPVVEGLTSKLESAVEDRFKTTSTEQLTVASTVEREFALHEPTSFGDRHVKSRDYQEAPVYRQLRLLIQKTCSWCESTEIKSTIVYQATQRTASRQIDYMSDGSKVTTATGTN